MIENTQSTLFDNLKQRLTNPFLFTYFWLFCTYNYKLFLYLWMEPLKMSEKLIYVEHRWDLVHPLFFALIAIVFFSFMDVVVDYIKESAERVKRLLFNKFGISKFYTMEEYDALTKRYRALRKDFEDIDSRYDQSKFGIDIPSKEIENNTNNSDSSSIINQNDSGVKQVKLKFGPVIEKLQLNIPENSLGLIRFAESAKDGVVFMKKDSKRLLKVDSVEDSIVIENSAGKHYLTNNNVSELLTVLTLQGYFVHEKNSYALTTKGYDLYDQVKFELVV